MIKHVVCHRYKDRAEAVKTSAMLNSLMGQVPSLRSIETGVDTLGSKRSYDMVLIAVFDDMQGLEEYQTHPAHLKVKEYIHTVLESAVAVDFEF